MPLRLRSEITFVRCSGRQTRDRIPPLSRRVGDFSFSLRPFPRHCMPLYFVSFRAILSPALVWARGVGGDHLSRFAARSLRPGEFALASVTSSIVPNVIRAYPPRRPARFGLNAGVAPAACEGLFTFGAVSILSISRGCYPRLRPFPAILFGLCLLSSNTIRYFSSKKSLLFAYPKYLLYLCTRKLTLGCLRDITGWGSRHI